MGMLSRAKTDKDINLLQSAQDRCFSLATVEIKLAFLQSIHASEQFSDKRMHGHAHKLMKQELENSCKIQFLCPEGDS